MKWCMPILDVYILLIASNLESAGMNYFSKVASKSVHFPNSTGVGPRATFCLLCAHSLAGVLSLKYVKVEATFFLSFVKESVLR